MTAATSTAPARRTVWFSYRRLPYGMLFILPALAYFVLFAFWPMINALPQFARVRYAVAEALGRAGVYQTCSRRDLSSFLADNRGLCSWRQCADSILSMGLALLLNQNIRFRTFFRTVFSRQSSCRYRAGDYLDAALSPFGPINRSFPRRSSSRRSR
jgi:hypothetical protein